MGWTATCSEPQATGGRRPTSAVELQESRGSRVKVRRLEAGPAQAAGSMEGNKGPVAGF